jgi:hypothetical protein
MIEAEFQNILRKQGITILVGIKCFLTVRLFGVL